MFAPNTKILVIDDMKTMRIVMKKALKQLGYEKVEEASDGDVALIMLQEAAQSGSAFELILSDWNMPKLKGIDLLRQIRANDKLKKTPFVMVTAESEKAQVLEAIKAGVNNYISKPFTAETVQQRLKAVHDKLPK
jgi:two-component system, chemotaxis family, chemotaxis protein CheY